MPRSAARDSGVLGSRIRPLKGGQGGAAFDPLPYAATGRDMARVAECTVLLGWDHGTPTWARSEILQDGSAWIPCYIMINPSQIPADHLGPSHKEFALGHRSEV